MFEKREELLMSVAELQDKSSSKWGTMKAVVLFVGSTLVIICLPVALFGMQPAEFVSMVSQWKQSASSSASSSLCPYLYVVLNVIILTLTFKSGALAASASHCSCPYPHHNAGTYTSDSSRDLLIRENKILRPQWKAEERSDDGTLKAAEAQKASSGLVLQRSSSFRELNCKKATKLSYLSRESIYIQPHHKYRDAPSVEVTFEICGEDGDNEIEESLSCEELNAKVESFIGNFYRELKMQREDSWNTLSAIYKQSC